MALQTYRIIGTRTETGERVEVSFRAESSAQATQDAIRHGIAVESVEPLGDTLVNDARPRYTGNYTFMQIAGVLLVIGGVLSALWGVLLMLLTLRTAIMEQGNAEQALVMFVGGVGAVAWGFVLFGLAEGLLALRRHIRLQDHGLGD